MSNIKLNANEFLALDEIMNGMNDVGDKMDMVGLVRAGEWDGGMIGGHGDTSAKDIAGRLEVSVKAAKGYIGSLAKKELIECDEEDGMLLVTAEGIEEWDKY